MSNKRDILFTNFINTYGLSRQNNSKIQQKNLRNGCKFNRPNIPIHDRALTWLDTDTSIKSGRVNLVLWS
jgi:hypothetical protein